MRSSRKRGFHRRGSRLDKLKGMYPYFHGMWCMNTDTFCKHCNGRLIRHIIIDKHDKDPDPWCPNPVCNGKMAERIRMLVSSNGLDIPHVDSGMIQYMSGIGVMGDPFMILGKIGLRRMLYHLHKRHPGQEHKAMEARRHILRMRRRGGLGLRRFLYATGFTAFFGEQMTDLLCIEMKQCLSLYGGDLGVYRFLTDDSFPRSPPRELLTATQINVFRIYFKEIWSPYLDNTNIFLEMLGGGSKTGCAEAISFRALKDLDVGMVEDVREGSLVKDYLMMNGASVHKIPANHAGDDPLLYYDVIIHEEGSSIRIPGNIVAITPQKAKEVFQIA